MWILWFCVVVAILTLIQMGVFRRYGLRGVRYHRRWDREACYEGDRAAMIEVLENRKLLPILWLCVESKISRNLRFKAEGELDVLHEQFHRSFFFLRGYKRLTRRHDIVCEKRGWYVLDSAHLTTGDLFGIARRSVDVSGDAELYVYPRPLAASESLTSLKWQGDIARRRWIMPDPILVTGIRDYRVGDPLRDVHWRASARTGRMQVRVRDFTVSPRILIMLNVQINENLMGAMEPDQMETIESGVRIAAHLASWACANGLECGLTCNGQLAGEPDRVVTVDTGPASPAHLEAILKSLARLELVRVLNIFTLLDRMMESGVTGMDIALVTAYRSDILDERAELLRERGNIVTFIPIDGAEVTDESQAG